VEAGQADNVGRVLTAAELLSAPCTREAVVAVNLGDFALADLALISG